MNLKAEAEAEAAVEGNREHQEKKATRGPTLIRTLFGRAVSKSASLRSCTYERIVWSK